MEIYFSHSGGGFGVRRCSESLAVQLASRKYFVLDINLLLAAVTLHRCTWAFSTCSEAEATCCAVVAGFSLRWLLLSSLPSSGSGKQAQQLWHMACCSLHVDLLDQDQTHILAWQADSSTAPLREVCTSSSSCGSGAGPCAWWGPTHGGR